MLRLPRTARLFAVAPLLLLLVVFGGIAQVRADAAPGAFADPAFANLWQASDAAVASNQAAHSYLYGPQPWAATSETYSQATNGHRLVQYLDKARLEISNATADATGPYYVTTGLLTRELVSGRVQTGDANTDYVQRAPAQVPVAGDPTGNATTPTFAAMAGVTTALPGQNVKAQRTGSVTDSIDATGTVTTLASPPANVNYANFYSQTGHTLADVFQTWLTDPRNGFAADPNTAPGAGRTAGWIYVLGLPISDPYWITGGVTIAGKPAQPVMVQLFERRTVTYEPGAPSAYQVQLGNVGQQYYRWRYGVTEPARSTTRLTVAATRTSSNKLDQPSAYGDIFQVNPDGSNKVNVNRSNISLVLNTIPASPTVPQSDYYPNVANVYPAPVPLGNYVAYLGNSSTGNNLYVSLYSSIMAQLNTNGNAVELPIYNSDGTTAGFYPSQVVWANSGQRLAFTSFRPATTAADNQTFYTDVSVVDVVDGGIPLTTVYAGTVARKTPTVVHLRWSPDASLLAFAEVIRDDATPTNITSQSLYLATPGIPNSATQIANTGDLLTAPTSAANVTPHVAAEWTPLPQSGKYTLVYESYGSRTLFGITPQPSAAPTKAQIAAGIDDFYGFAPGSNRYAAASFGTAAATFGDYITADISAPTAITEFFRAPLGPVGDPCATSGTALNSVYSVRWLDATQLGVDVLTTTNAGSVICTPTSTTSTTPTVTTTGTPSVTATGTTTTTATTTATGTPSVTTTATVTTTGTTTATTTAPATTTTTTQSGNVRTNAIALAWTFYVANYNSRFPDATTTDPTQAVGIINLSAAPFNLTRSAADGPIFVSATPTDFALANTVVAAGSQAVTTVGRALNVAPNRGPTSGIATRTFALSGAFWVNAFVTTQ